MQIQTKLEQKKKVIKQNTSKRMTREIKGQNSSQNKDKYEVIKNHPLFGVVNYKEPNSATFPQYKDFSVTALKKKETEF